MRSSAVRQPKAKRRIAIIDGHPDTQEKRFVHALAEAYQSGAETAGHEVKMLRVAQLEFPLLRANEDFQTGTPPDSIRQAQEAITWADHLVILFPLWLGAMPALLKGFLEQCLRPGFAFGAAMKGKMPQKLLKGKSARIIVTMGMPALFYRWYYRAHSLKSLERNILTFCGIHPVRANVIGMIEGSLKHRQRWLAKLEGFGRAGS